MIKKKSTKKKYKNKLFRIEIEETIKRHYFLGKEIWKNEIIDLDKYLNTRKGENIVFDINIKEEYIENPNNLDGVRGSYVEYIPSHL